MKILLVRRDNIGDLVCTTPLLAALRERLPQAHLAALVTSYTAEVLARNPAVDALWVIEKWKHRTRGALAHVAARLRLIWRLRKERFDCALVPAPTPQSLAVARAVRPRRIVAGLLPEADGHEVERAFALARGFGVEGPPGPLRVYPDPARVAALRKRLGAGFVAVHVSARRPRQRWPAERWAALLRALSGRGPVVLLWAPGAREDPRHPGDDALAARIVALAGGAARALATPALADLVAALALAGRVVCPDGGAMHLAAALGKPLVALFGDSPVGRWRPWQVPHRIVQPPSRNLAELEIEPVLAAFDELAS